MALTNNLKPAGFQPVGGGSLLYKWTESDLSGKTNYRVVVQLDGYTSVLPDYEYRPDVNGIVWADIAPLLRSLLALDETVASRMINTYVKYQAVWDESSDAQVNLSGDVIYAYVGNNHALNYRTKFDIKSSDGNADPELATGVFLSYSDIKIPINKNSYIDFLVDGSLPSNAEFRSYKPNGTLYNNASFNGTTHILRSEVFTPDSTTGVWQIRVTNSAGTLIYAMFKVEVVEVCSNPLYIRWLNDYGGLAHYMFDYNQIYGLQVNASDKAKVVECGAYGVTFEQWLMLNELHRDGIVYNDNYKQGQFIEDVTDYANPVPLISIPKDQATQTKRVGHNIEFAFRYPLIANNGI